MVLGAEGEVEGDSEDEEREGALVEGAGVRGEMEAGLEGGGGGGLDRLDDLGIEGRRQAGEGPLWLTSGTRCRWTTMPQVGVFV
jgi:hypothetical protein